MLDYSGMAIGGTLDFSIKTHVFEGPLELLIELCEKRKLLINDISLAEVTDEYIRRVSEMQEKSLPNTAQFIGLAATLLLIKSKSLLPVLELTKEEDEINLPSDIALKLSECVDYAYDMIPAKHRQLSTALQWLPVNFSR